VRRGHQHRFDAGRCKASRGQRAKSADEQYCDQAETESVRAPVERGPALPNYRQDSEEASRTVAASSALSDYVGYFTPYNKLDQHNGVVGLPCCSASRAETGIGQIKTQDQRRAHVDIKVLLVLQGVEKLHRRFRRQREENRTSNHDKPADQRHDHRQCAP